MQQRVTNVGAEGGAIAANRSRGPASRNVVVASSKKTDVKKQGLSSIKDEVVKANLMGISRKMKDKNWTDSQGRKGKVCCSSYCGLCL